MKFKAGQVWGNPANKDTWCHICVADGDRLSCWTSGEVAYTTTAAKVRRWIEKCGMELIKGKVTA